MKRALGLLLILVSLACSGSDSTGPKNADVSGVWTYNATNLQGSGGVICNVFGTTLTLAQSGTTFSGTYSGGTFSCNNGSGAIGTGVVATGTVSGSNVTFNLDTSDWANTGVVSGTSMSGTAVVRIGSTVTTGSFSAVKR